MKKKNTTKTKKNFSNIEQVKIYITSTFNNTKITTTDMNGDVLFFDTSGTCGFKGTKKNTPFAAQKAAENTSKRIKLAGVHVAHILLCGPGHGREAAAKTISKNGIEIKTITDITKFPFNGCRPPKKRRV